MAFTLADYFVYKFCVVCRLATMKTAHCKNGNIVKCSYEWSVGVWVVRVMDSCGNAVKDDALIGTKELADKSYKAEVARCGGRAKRAEADDGNDYFVMNKYAWCRNFAAISGPFTRKKAHKESVRLSAITIKPELHWIVADVQEAVRNDPRGVTRLLGK